eukprot:3051782-Pleurochrysis_carterae.AAC.1
MAVCAAPESTTARTDTGSSRVDESRRNLMLAFMHPDNDWAHSRRAGGSIESVAFNASAPTPNTPPSSVTVNEVGSVQAGLISRGTLGS